MEDAKDIISLAFKGCSLARNFESNIPNLLLVAHHDHHDHHWRRILVDQCDEIIGAFTMVRHQLEYSLHPRPPLVVDQPEVVVAALSREMVAFGYTPPPPPPTRGKGKEVADDGCMMNVDSSSGGGQVQQQQRNSTRTSRKEENGRTMRVAAPQMGNTEVPPEDGHTWRKYGQKVILGARYPRSYYRCTHKKLCNCPAKKQVQRLDDDPSTFEIHYHGDHTCHMSSTAPSVPPPPPSQSLQHIIGQNSYEGISPTPYRPTIIPPPSQLNQSLFMDLHRPSSEGTNTVFEAQQHQMVRASSCSSIGGNNNASAGPSFAGSSAHHHGRNAVDFLSNPVMDLADVMFNSGSSSGNSMECIFPHSDDK